MCGESFLDARANLLGVDGVGGDTFFFDELLNLWDLVLEMGT